MAKERDPYSKVIDALWEALEANERFASMVKAGNRIKFTGDNRDPIKLEVGEGDLPEVRIIVASSAPMSKGASNMVGEDATFEIQVSSGDQRLDVRHLPLKWAVFRVLTRAWQTLAATTTNLKWNNKRFVHHVRPTTVTEGVSQADLNRGIKGWSAIWACVVEMHFTRSDL